MADVFKVVEGIFKSLEESKNNDEFLNPNPIQQYFQEEDARNASLLEKSSLQEYALEEARKKARVENSITEISESLKKLVDTKGIEKLKESESLSTSASTSDTGLTKLENQQAAILEAIATKQYDPLAIPDGGKERGRDYRLRDGDFKEWIRENNPDLDSMKWCEIHRQLRIRNSSLWTSGFTDWKKQQKIHKGRPGRKKGI